MRESFSLRHWKRETPLPEPVVAHQSSVSGILPLSLKTLKVGSRSDPLISVSETSYKYKRHKDDIHRSGGT